ncbi:MAG: carboxylesterase family protein [Planctomycetota bacterium]|jgi:predicted peptidase
MKNRSRCIVSGLAVVACLSSGCAKTDPDAKLKAMSRQELHARAERVRPDLEKVLERFETRTFSPEKGAKMPYRFFAPKIREDGKTYPLVVYLHGSAGRGSDNTKQVTGGNTWGSRIWLLPENQKAFPCFVVAPQSSSEGAAWTKEKLAVLKTLLDQIVKEFSIDKSRIYVTGQSMGGSGAWFALTTYPEFFAAGVPICGGGNADMARVIAEHDIGVWAFHGARDSVAPESESREMIEAIRKAGGNPRYTVYPDEGHASWMGAYTESQLLPWLFSHKKPVAD